VRRLGLIGVLGALRDKKEPSACEGRGSKSQPVVEDDDEPYATLRRTRKKEIVLIIQPRKLNLNRTFSRRH